MAALSCALAVACLAPSAASAADALELKMMVALAGDEDGPIDPRAKKLDQKLKRDFRYKSLRVLSTETRKVGLDDVVGIELPDGRKARVRPLSLDASGALLAVDIEGAVKVDARAGSGHLLVFGAGKHEGGRLVVSIEPSF